jgi:hypothetical protein
MIDVSVSTALMVAGLMVIMLYFTLLSRKMRVFTPETRKQFTEKSDDLGNLLSIIPLAAAFAIDNLMVKFVLMLIGLFLLHWQTHVHHLKLKKRGFSPVFVDSLGRLSLLVVLGIGLILTSNVIGSDQSLIILLTQK